MRRYCIAVLVLGLLASALLGVAAAADERGETLQRRESPRAKFTVACSFTHRLPDDPIVFPGQPRASHSHDFFGNPVTDAHTTADDLTASNDTTCDVERDRSAYWVPSMYDGDGELVQGKRLVAYYFAAVADPSEIEPYPEGLEMVTSGRHAWNCITTGSFFRPDDQSVPPDCPEGMDRTLRISFPDCWNGRDLRETSDEGEDGRPHVAFSEGRACPPTHPRAMPALVISIRYASQDGPLVAAPREDPSAPHADFFAAWDRGAMQRLIWGCLVQDRPCSREDVRRMTEPPLLTAMAGTEGPRHPAGGTHPRSSR